jgi:predicted GIY-YIG superfamily endonuclease
MAGHSTRPARAGLAHGGPSSFSRTIPLLHYVYILRCADGTLYTGCARDPLARVAVHNAGRGAKYTAGRCPVVLAYVEPCETLGAALAREHQLKRWTRSKKDALISRNAAGLKASKPTPSGA